MLHIIYWTVLLMSIYYGKTYKSSGKTQTLPDSSMDASIEVNAQKTKYSNTSPNTLFKAQF